MKYTIKAKPTLYKGIEFRSRLEARWAAFFDLLEWKWEYEPCDFNGWYPDFVIFGKKADERITPTGHDGRIFVEVKPVIDFPKDVANRMTRSLPHEMDNTLLILGQRPLERDGFMRNRSLGWMYNSELCWAVSKECEYLDSWEPAVFGRWANGNGLIGFCPCGGSFVDQITWEHDGGHYGDLSLADKDILKLWGDAHKTVRFESRNGKKL